MNFYSVLADIIATVVGGVLLTFLFFLAREKIFPIPIYQEDGIWKLK